MIPKKIFLNKNKKNKIIKNTPYEFSSNLIFFIKSLIMGRSISLLPVFNNKPIASGTEAKLKNSRLVTIKFPKK